MSTKVQENTAIPFTIDPTKKPRWITFTPPVAKGKVVKGIYELTDDTLTLCLPVEAKAARPKKFTSNVANQNTFGIFKRMKAD